MQLNGPQMGKFNEVIRDSFEPDDFDLFLKFRLDKRTSDFAGQNAKFPVVVDKVITAANMQGWILDLMVKAREAIPRNEKLWAFVQQFGMASTSEPRQELQRIITKAKLFLDVNVWRSRLAEIEAQVCRIEIETDQGKVINGTGFLFGGPDSILTNYHVVEPLIVAAGGAAPAGAATAKPANVKVRFDFKRIYDPVTKQEGPKANPGVLFDLADKWLIDHSESHPLDPASQPPPPDRLDYALLRLAEPAGSTKVGDPQNQFGVKRGYINLPDTAHQFEADEPLAIMQHPSGRPLKLALDDEAVIGVNQNGTRVTYKTNTETGSSGSPCFTMKLDLVALHHSGDPDFDPEHKPSYNEGIPISAITKLMRERGVDKEIGEQEL